MKCLGLLLACAAAAAGGTSISFQSKGLPSGGAKVYCANDPEFAFALQTGFLMTPSDLGAAGRLALVVENRGSSSIAAVTVRYESMDAGGRTYTDIVRWSSVNPALQLMSLAPGSSLVVTLEGGFPNTGAVVLSGEKSRHLLARSRSIVVSLDSVLFSDGTLAGADASGTLAHFRAQADAYVEIGEALLAAGDEVDPVLERFLAPGRTPQDRLAASEFRSISRFSGRDSVLEHARKSVAFYRSMSFRRPAS